MIYSIIMCWHDQDSADDVYTDVVEADTEEQALNIVRQKMAKHQECELATAEEILMDYAQYWEPILVYKGVNIFAADKMLKALQIAEQLATIASDWNLEEVEIDRQMVGISKVREIFTTAIKEATTP